MEWFQKVFEGKPAWKIILGLGVSLIGLVVIVWLIGFAFRAATGSIPQGFSGIGGGAPSYSYDYDNAGYKANGYYAESVSETAFAPQISMRNITLPPRGTSTIGGDAEDFEVTDYTVSYESGELLSLCADIEGLKSREYIVFESSNKSDKNCYYAFKVEKSHVEEVKAVLESLEPELLIENTYTIKTEIQDFTSREDILKKKLTAIEETLTQAQRAYDELRVLATSARDAESLAKVIESKINLIERLTNERLSLREQLDQLAQAKALQLDRLDYTYFNVDVSEKLIVDFEAIKDAWVAELQRFVREVNLVVQGITLELLAFALRVFQMLLYAFIVLVVIKFGWRFVKGFWKA